MKPDWEGYELFDPGYRGPAASLSRAEAQRAYERCMATKDARIAALRELVRRNGVRLDTDDESIQALNDWFVSSIEPDPENPGLLRPAWYSVAHDVALFLGDVMIGRHPHLHWELFTGGKRDLAYQRHVIMGLTSDKTKLRTYIDIDDIVHGYAHLIVEVHGSIPAYGTVEVRGTKIDVDVSAESFRARGIDPDRFLSLLERAAARA